MLHKARRQAWEPGRHEMRAAVSPASFHRSSSSPAAALLAPPMSAPRMCPPSQGVVHQPAAESAACAAL
eukprot:7133264-Alexandrium_andersonii.AAC.1